jgi:hypothetical protein
MDQALENRINQLINKLVENYRQFGTGATDISFELRPGKKYIKIVEKYAGSNSSVHAFVDKNNGDLYKPATWLAPAKHVRFNLLDDASFERCIGRADWAGGYLYM